MIQQAPGRVSRRAPAVVWWLEGASQAALRRRAGVSRQRVPAWCTRFQQVGVAGLWDRPRSGRPARASAALPQAIAACLAGRDVAGNRGPGGWTGGRRLAARARDGIAASAHAGRRALARLEARGRRGRLVARGDPQRGAGRSSSAHGGAAERGATPRRRGTTARHDAFRTVGHAGGAE